MYLNAALTEKSSLASTSLGMIYQLQIHHTVIIK